MEALVILTLVGAYFLLRKPKAADTPVAPDAAVPEDASPAAPKLKGIAATTAPKLTGIASDAPQMTLNPSIDFPPSGWFGAVVAHGGACQLKGVQYIKKHGHLTPSLAASWKHLGTDIDLDWSRKTLLSERYFEPAAPPFPGRGPVWCADSQMAYPKKELVTTLVDWQKLGYSATSTQTGISGVAWYSDRVSLSRQILRGRVMKSDSSSTHVYPARAVTEWAVLQTQARVGAGKNHGVTPAASAKYVSSDLVVPGYWMKSEERRLEWADRMVRWYHNAAWLVWAGEMLREHSTPWVRPSWWLWHCAAWGIGVPDESQRVQRHSYTADDSTLHVPFKSDEVESVLRQILSHTPQPGSPGSRGTQIAAKANDAEGKPLYKRSLCDIPIEAGSMQPPIEMSWWTVWSLANWQKKSGYFDGVMLIMNIFQSITSAVGFAAGASIAASVSNAVAQTAINLAFKVVSVVVQNSAALASGNWKALVGDVVGVISEAVVASGIDLGSSKLETLSPEVWSAVKKAGSAIPAFGDDAHAAAGARVWLTTLQGQLAAVKQTGWDWLDEAYSGIGMSGKIYGELRTAQAKG